jgi:hypothetical protein
LNPNPLARLGQKILRVTGTGFDHAEHGAFRIREHGLVAALWHLPRRGQHATARLRHRPLRSLDTADRDVSKPPRLGHSILRP